MTHEAFLDRPVLGWFVLDVMPIDEQSLDWCALMIDVDPDTDEFRLASRPKTSCFVRVPGKHTSRDEAWDAFLDLMETRH